MKAFSPEVDRNKELTTLEKVLGIIAVIAMLGGAIVISMIFAGCKAFYENGGSSGRVGSVTAPIEISDGTDSLSCRLLFGMDGAYWYTRKDSKVTVEYDIVYTNTYIGCVNTRGNQHLKIEVEPLYVGEAETNTISTINK